MVVWAHTKMALSRFRAKKWSETNCERSGSTFTSRMTISEPPDESLVVEVLGHEVTQRIRRESDGALECPSHLDQRIGLGLIEHGELLGGERRVGAQSVGPGNRTSGQSRH